MEEKELITRLQQGDESAFEALVVKYQNYIFRLALSVLRDEEDAKEMTQEVFIKIYTSIRGFNNRSALSTWIYRITYNLCIDHLKKHQKKKRLTSSLDDGESTEILGLKAESGDPQDSLERQELRKDIRAGLNTLSEEHRILIELKDIQGFSYEEILAITGLKDGTLKSRLSRARLALRKYLEEKWNIKDNASSKDMNDNGGRKEDGRKK